MRIPILILGFKGLMGRERGVAIAHFLSFFSRSQTPYGQCNQANLKNIGWDLLTRKIDVIPHVYFTRVNKIEVMC